MSERRGFWSPRSCRGRDDAQLLAAERVHALRQLPYETLRGSAERGAQVERVAGLSGQGYERRTTVKRFSRGGIDELRITVQVSSGSWLGRLNPLAEEAILMGPDGEMVGEYTMASEGNDPRRYRWPSRGD